MSNIYNQKPNFKEIAKRENNFNYSVASLGDIYRPYLESPKVQRQYDILSEEEMKAKGLIPGKSNIGYKNYSKSNYPQDPNIKNVNINKVDLGKGLSKNVNLNQGKSPGVLKGSKIRPQRQSSAISTKKIKYNQEFDPAQKNRLMDVNYLHLTKLPESKKFSHVDKAIIHPVQSTFSVKKIVDDNIKKHEKMMRPIVLFPDPVRIYNQQPEKILPGSLRRSQEEIKEFENSNARKNMMVIGQGFGNKNNIRDNHVIFENPKEKKFRRKATSTRLARNTLKKSEQFVEALENYFLSTDLKVPPKYDIKTILEKYAQELEKSLDGFENEISGKGGMKDDISQFLYKTTFNFKKKRKKKFNIQYSKKPKISEIDYEFRKKIQERLSRLQINLRQIFDNISMLKKNKTKQNIKLINEQIHKARELTNYVRHLATDVQNGEEEFKNSFQRNKSSSQEKKPNLISQNISNSSINTSNIIPQNITTMSKTMNNFNHPNMNISDNNNVSNNQPNMSKTNAQLENNKLEYSSTSVGSNINPMNSFSSENQIKLNNPKINQSQNSTLMTSKANVYMKNKNFNPIIEESNEDVNYNTSKVTNNNIQPNQTGKSTNQNYFLQSTNSFQEIKEKPPQLTKTKTKPMKQTKSKTKPKINPNSKRITVTLAEPAYFQQRPLTSQEFRGTRSISLSNPKSSDILTQSRVINNIDQTINHVPMKAEEMKVNTQNYIEDERYSAFNVEFPIKYYYELSREHEPPKSKEWYLRPHHTETFVESKKAIPDDIMNTKYISYYAPATTEKQ